MVDEAASNSSTSSTPTTNSPAIAAAHGNQLIEQERWVELERLVSRIPTDLLDNDPDLLMLSCVGPRQGAVRATER